MATTTNRPSVYVASNVRGLTDTLRRLSPNDDVIEIPVDDDSEKVSPKDKEMLCLKAEVLLAEQSVIMQVLYNAKKLKWAQSISAGANSIVNGIDTSKPIPNIPITRIGKGFGKIMAEYVLCHIMGNERRIFNIYEEQKIKKFDKREYEVFRSLSSLRLGIIGAGQIGTEIGNVCKWMGMEVWVLSRQLKPELAHFDAQKTPDQLPELLQNCDYICSVLPSTPATKGLLSGDILENCKEKQTVLINIGRGDVIDEGSIAKAIKNKWIGGAILDVFEKEPLPKDSVLWSLPNVIITPHVSGPSSAKQVVEVFLENFQNYLDGKPLKYRVDFEKGY